MKEGYKQTEIGVIPEDWEAKQIGSFAKICMCKRIFADQTSKVGDIPFYKIGTFDGTPDAYISRSLYSEYKSKYSYPEKGDVLISAAGTLGRTVVFDGADSYFQDSNIVWLDIDKAQICNEYLKHYYEVIKWAASEGSTISRLYNGIIESTYVSVPPLAEQHRIAEALSDMDELIASLEKLIAKKKAIKQGAMQELLTGKRRLPGFTGEWREVPIGEWGYLTKECVNPQLYPTELFWEYSMPAYDEDEKPVKQVGKNMHSNRTRIKGTVLLFNKLNVRQKRIWYVENCGSNAVCSSEFLAYCSEKIDLRLVKYILGSDTAISDFVGMSTGTSNSQKRITPDCFLEYKIIIPIELDEQNAIADILENMDKECKVLEDELEKARQIKHGMMQQLLTGKIRLLRSTKGGK